MGGSNFNILHGVNPMAAEDIEDVQEGTPDTDTDNEDTDTTEEPTPGMPSVE
jgi:hypothetical protein